jgi:hypothetical protein
LELEITKVDYYMTFLVHGAIPSNNNAGIKKEEEKRRVRKKKEERRKKKKRDKQLWLPLNLTVRCFW